MSRSRVARGIVVVVGLVWLEWFSRPGAVESVEEGVLVFGMGKLAKKAEGVEKEIAELVKLLVKVGEEGGKGRLEVVRDRVLREYDEVEEQIRTDEENLRAQDDKTHETFTEWLSTIGPGCKTSKSSPPTPTNPPPKHPIGGGEAEIDYDALEAQRNAAQQPPFRPSQDYVDPCKDRKPSCRRNAIKSSFLHAWDGYKEHAWGHDELKPLLKSFRDWGETGLGITLIDGLSTLWIMGLHKEFGEAVSWVGGMDVGVSGDYSQFELVIRVVGGLVSAYELSGEKHHILIKKAAVLADKILHAYNTKSGIPDSTINLKTLQSSNSPWAGTSAILSELSSTQLELRTLSFHTRNPYYDQITTYITDLLDSITPSDSLLPTHLNKDTAEWSNDHITLGAMGDSYYEYLLKQYLLTGKTEKRYKVMYKKALGSIVKKLIKRSEPSGDTYLAELKKGSAYNKMDHLACFAGGMFALGVEELDQAPNDDEIEKHAEGLAETCYKMYSSQPTGLAPELVMFRGGGDMERLSRGSYTLLRPETVETLMYLYRTTGKEKYREYGWAIYTAIEKHCKVPSGGYTGLRDVAQDPPVPDDLQQSFLLSETFKYLYLLFSDRDGHDTISLKEWVFNTEGHPLKIRARNPFDLWSKDAIAAREKYLVKHAADRVKDFTPIPVEEFNEARFMAALKSSLPDSSEGSEQDDSSGSYESGSSADGSISNGGSEQSENWSARLSRLRAKAVESERDG